ncbi:MAG: hypothetical protein Q4A71_07555 [Actinomycetaceae bacterium]|nr:hypothetical protein [Actinomycetaceae bacterium]
MEDFLQSLEDAFELRLAGERNAEVFELAEAARTGTRLRDVVRHEEGGYVSFDMRSGGRIEGIAQNINVAWAEVKNAGGLSIVALRHIVALRSKGRSEVSPSKLEERRTIGAIMRQIARTGRIVQVLGEDGRTWRGRITGVGADYLQLDRMQVVRLDFIETIRPV